MATIAVYALGGLDKKSNDLNRAVDKASDMVNMEYDTQSTIKKRNGYAEVSIDGSTSSPFDDLAYYNTKDEILGFTHGSADVKIINPTTLTSKTLMLPSGALGSLVSISSCENQQNLYFTPTDYSSYVMKYDGSNIYRAGLPTPRDGATSFFDNYPTLTGSSAGYTRVFYSQKDINGNIAYSPYVEYSHLPDTGSLTINSLKTDTACLENGFLGKYCYKYAAGTQIINSGSRTLVLSRHNYIAGEKFLMDTENQLIFISPAGKSFIVLDIESVTSTSITFTASSLGAYSITILSTSTYVTEYPVDVRTKVFLYTSSSQATNYKAYTVFSIDNSSVSNVLSLSGSIEPVLNKLISGGNFEDMYDSTTLKTMPPICKFIASFGYQIVYGSIQSFFSGFTHSGSNPNKRMSYANQSLIIYSDTSVGDGPEGVSELNRQKIGETWDGDITGLRRCNDSMIVFKTRGVFSLDGFLAQGQYALRKLNTNFVGCTYHKSILEAEEGLYFQAHNGIYFTNAIQVQKMTYELDSLFLSKDYISTRAVMIKKKQKSMFYVPDIAAGTSKVVVVDYYYQQVYTWSFNNLMGNGIISDKLGDVYFCDGSKIYKFNDTYTDNGAPISSVYATTWHNAGSPSLNKKWNSIRTWGLTNDAFTATIVTEGDWQAGTSLTTNQSVYGSTTQTDFKMLNMQTKRALRVIFSNNTNNENMVLTGYELTYEMFNGVDKN